jgi:hypothetical protein
MAQMKQDPTDHATRLLSRINPQQVAETVEID